ncbi:MAG: EF-Tu/IF-2/RF-3 family GTPase [Nitrososphaeraceae archaeon]
MLHEEKLRTLIKDNSVSRFEFLDSIDQLKQEMSRLESKGHIDGPVIIPIDHVFDVKGVGTVVMRVVKQGSVKVYYQLKIMPSGEDIVVKSIQMRDDPVDESNSPARVGLAVKGMTAEQIAKGDILCSEDSSSLVKVVSPAAATAADTASTIASTDFMKNPSYKGDLVENQTYLISVGLQIRPVRSKLLDGLAVEIIPESKSIVFFPGQTYVLLSPDSQGTRIIGKGILN